MNSLEENWPEEDRKESARIRAEIEEAEKKSKWFVALLIGGLCTLPVLPLGIALLVGSYFWHEHYQGKIGLLHRLYKQLLDKNKMTSGGGNN